MVQCKTYFGALWKERLNADGPYDDMINYLSWHIFVPDLVNIELIFFIQGGMVLCFEFRRKILLRARWCFTYGWAVLTTFWLVILLANKKAGFSQEEGRTADLNWSKGYSIPYSVMQNYKLWGAGKAKVAHCWGTGLALVIVGGKQLCCVSLVL